MGKVKPVLVAIPQVAYEEDQRYVRALFVQAKLPVFPSVERAALALTNDINYYTKSRMAQTAQLAVPSRPPKELTLRSLQNGEESERGCPTERVQSKVFLFPW
ncbi:MAG: hypothetical protein KIH01_05075 [Candidatus Freyarchaeota archaeon]|nr:hypothetical protein [Candidatus Jordarchaeia archaeon]